MDRETLRVSAASLIVTSSGDIVSSAASHRLGGAAIRTLWPRGHWSLLGVRHGRGAGAKIAQLDPQVGLLEGLFLPAWLSAWLSTSASVQRRLGALFGEGLL